MIHEKSPYDNNWFPFTEGARMPKRVPVDPVIKVTEGALNPAAIDRIVGYGDVCAFLLPIKGRIGYNVKARQEPETRDTDVAWLHYGLPETNWIYEMLGELFMDSNNKYWQMNIKGIHDQVQYCVYKSAVTDGTKTTDGKFNWHRDSGDDWHRPQRKLSISIQLTEQGKDYEGGDFFIFDGGPVMVPATRKAGTVCVFPSTLSHAVAPVKSGIRKSLVAWCTGPKLR